MVINVWCNNRKINYKSPIAAIFQSELQYMLEMHFALEDYYDISFAHQYFHGHTAYNIAELEATDYFNGLDSSLIGTFRIEIPITTKLDFDV